jgi:FkbM family methyltransferase
MTLGKRQWRDLSYVLARRETYGALLQAFSVFESPVSVLKDELFSSSLHNKRVSLKTPVGRLQANLHSPVDLSTVMGVFCRQDYRLAPTAKVVVDIGANIGIASLYFLSRSTDVVVYAYEPVPRNVERCLQNTEPFAARFSLSPTAVGTRTQMVRFGVEPTGKFGGMKLDSPESIEVPCVSINHVMEQVLSRHDRVHCLKIDIEGSEAEVLSSMHASYWSRVDCIFAENCDSRSYMPRQFDRTFRYNVERLQSAFGK